MNNGSVAFECSNPYIHHELLVANDKYMKNEDYPDVQDTANVGTFPALAKSGAGYVWDEVLEYRVWCHPEDGEYYSRLYVS